MADLLRFSSVFILSHYKCVNQIAKRVNSDGNVVASDVKDIQENYEKLWNQSEIIFENIAKLKL